MTALLSPLRDGRFVGARILRIYPAMLMTGFGVSILFLALPFVARLFAAAIHLLIAPFAILALLVMTGTRTKT